VLTNAPGHGRFFGISTARFSPESRFRRIARARLRSLPATSDIARPKPCGRDASAVGRRARDSVRLKVRCDDGPMALFA